jgi:hypothetical protein
MDTLNVRQFFKTWDGGTLKWASTGGQVTAIGVIVANDEQAKTLCAGLSIRARGELFKVRMEWWLAGMRARRWSAAARRHLVDAVLIVALTLAGAAPSACGSARQSDGRR